MGIKIDICAETPLSDDDRDILASISVMVLAIADRQNFADHPHKRMDDEEEPEPCGDQRDDGQVCVREAGHSAHRKYRPLNGLVN
jgi:hypothetical protein